MGSTIFNVWIDRLRFHLFFHRSFISSQFLAIDFHFIDVLIWFADCCHFSPEKSWQRTLWRKHWLDTGDLFIAAVILEHCMPEKCCNWWFNSIRRFSLETCSLWRTLTATNKPNRAPQSKNLTTILTECRCRLDEFSRSIHSCAWKWMF